MARFINTADSYPRILKRKKTFLKPHHKNATKPQKSARIGGFALPGNTGFLSPRTITPDRFF